jgi:hypothetical protein
LKLLLAPCGSYTGTISRCSFDEAPKMKKIQVKDKSHIRQLLYTECVLGIKDNQYKGFGGFQLWWYDKKRGVCDCCESHWLDHRKKLVHYKLDKAAKILWRHRDSLYVRSKHVSEDSGILTIEHLEDAKQ